MARPKPVPSSLVVCPRSKTLSRSSAGIRGRRLRRKAVAVVEGADPDRHRLAGVVDGVAEEVLEHLLEARPVGLDRPILDDVEGGPGVATRPQHWVTSSVRSTVSRSVACWPCRARVSVSLMSVAIRSRASSIASSCSLSCCSPDELEAALGNVERRAEVVADDGGELLEAVVLSLQGPRALPKLLLAFETRQRLSCVVHEQLREVTVGLVERARVSGDRLERPAVGYRHGQRRAVLGVGRRDVVLAEVVDEDGLLSVVRAGRERVLVEDVRSK